MTARRIGVIGAGNMGTALLRGILASEWGTKTRLIASHPKKSKAAALARELGIRVFGQNIEVALKADVLIRGEQLESDVHEADQVQAAECPLKTL